MWKMEIISRARVRQPTVGQIQPSPYFCVILKLRMFFTFVKECKKQTEIVNNKKLNRQEKEEEEVKEEGEEKTEEDGEEEMLQWIVCGPQT